MNSLLQMSGWYVHDRYIKVPHNILEKTTHMKLTFYNIPNEKKNGVKSIAQFLLCGIFEPNNNALLNHVIYINAVSYTHLRAHETPEHLVCRLLLEKKKKKI